MTLDLEERIRGALHDVADGVTYDDGEVVDLAPRRRARPLRALVVAGLAAAAIAGIALAVGSTASRHSTPATASTPPSTLDGTTTTLLTPSDPQTEAALATWAAFPATAQPRRLVLIDADTDGPAAGFTNPDIAIADAEKEAFDAGAMTTPASFPSGPATADGFPIVSASDAFAHLRSEGTGTASTTLQTTSVQLGTGSFLTDRGWTTLPAWLVSFRDVEHPVAVLAVAPAALFPNPVTDGPPTQLGAQTTPGSTTIELTFPGARDDTGPCGAIYTAYVSESPVAVSVAVVAVTPPAPTTTTTPGVVFGCTDEAYSRHVTVTLRDPLGARVLVDAKTKRAVSVDQ